jgi:VWFA-related protein
MKFTIFLIPPLGTGMVWVACLLGVRRLGGALLPRAGRRLTSALRAPVKRRQAAAVQGRAQLKMHQYLALVLLVVSSAQSHAQQSHQPEEDVVRVDTTLVTLPVKVTNRQGQVAYGLQQPQFRVFENGFEQEIVYFEAPQTRDDVQSNSRPLTVALMLDISDSTEFKLAKIQRAALSFVDLLRSGDRVLVVSFDRQVRVLAEATADRTILREAIKGIKTGGGTSLYRALDEIINTRLARVVGRKAVVLLTDGVDTTSTQASFESTIRAAETSDVTIFPVQYPTYTDFSDNPLRETYSSGSFANIAHVTKNGEFASEAYKRATLFLRLLADKTAGRFQFADSGKNLAHSFESIAAQLREQYVLGYYPKSKVAGPREIKVKVLAPEATVHTRRHYIYQSSPR